ncbi:YkvA family protein [Streptomyces showdoensis]|uniref:Membrane protein n=1 Tax=Streptomyces showdoensis TaxID=68268 RepID=A0A2P2GLF9_STREW|nr:YkvA family protein [Streptomyces showdoensis]KKZ71689.1 membrane protein [Streptomyces showdoensis]
MDGSLWAIAAVILLLALATIAVVLLVRVFRARRMLRDAGVPLQSKALFWAAVVYTISPVDLIPDPVYLDDIGVLLITLRVLHTAATKSKATPEQLPEEQ